MNLSMFKVFLPVLALLAVQFSYAQQGATVPKNKPVEEIVGLVNTYCGTCHSVPPPSLMPKKSWPYVIKKMAEIAAKNTGQEVISAENIRHITAYYYGSSPASLPFLPYPPNAESPVSFSVTEQGQSSEMPLVINVHSVNLMGGGAEFLVCDSEQNQILLLSQKGKSWQETVLAKVDTPSHTEVVDFDFDGDMDIVVGALGLFFPPTGAYAGKVFLLRQTAPGKFKKELLFEGVGRITDAQPMDIDGDKDLDIAISIFGGDAAGELAWLENLGSGKYSKHTMMKVGGGLNISPVDLNNDGRMDFVSFITQQHELIAGLINQGGGKFKKTLLFKAGHPMVGATSMRLVDLDGDKDIDMLFSNGDANDFQYDPKPYHGVQWLENKGALKFEYHNIGRFYGAVGAEAGDMDLDGDLDIVASSWNNYWEDPKRQSLIWFENDGKQNFTRHNIISRPQSITSFDLTDVNGDNRLDIVAGVFRMDLLRNSYGEGDAKKENVKENTPEPLLPRLILLENKAVKQ